MNRVTLLIGGLTILAALSACQPSTTFQNAIPQTDTRAPVPTAVPLATAVIADPPQAIPFEEICPDLTNGLPEAGSVTGKLILFDHNQDRLVRLDLATGELSPALLTTETALSYTISPDGKWLAYESQGVEWDDKRFILANALGEPVLELPWADRWFKLAYWLDAERVVIQMYPDENDNLLAGNHDRLIVYNPYTEEERMLINKFSQLRNMEYPKNWKGAGQTIFDPTLERAVFAGMAAYHLGDMTNTVVLAHVDTLFLPQWLAGAPQWSPDGEFALVAAQSEASEYVFELYTLHRDGAITQLTNFIDFYPSIGIQRYGWSPDGNNIAFFSASDDPFYPERFALLDFGTKDLIYYCYQGDITSGRFRQNLKYYYDEQVYAGVVWTPDSNYMVIENRIEENSSNIILLDIEKNLGYMLFEDQNLQPIGWMVDSQN